MKQGAPKQHLVKRRYPGGVQTLFMNTVSQFGLFLGEPGALKKQPKMKSKSIQNGDVGSQKALREPLQKSVENCIDFGRLLGLEMGPGGGFNYDIGILWPPKKQLKT